MGRLYTETNMPATRINGFDMHYELLGPLAPETAAAPPIVLIHGFPMDGRIWNDVAAQLSRRHRIIVPDLRGFGQSREEAPAMPGQVDYTIEALADDVLALLEHLGAIPAVLAGLSMGGYVALSLVRRHPSAVAGLGLINTRPGAEDEAGRTRRSETALRLANQGAAAARDIVEQMLPKLLSPCGRDRGADGEALADRLRRIMMDVAPEAMRRATLAMRDRHDQRDLLPALKIPAAVVAGSEDTITPLDTAGYDFAPGVAVVRVLEGAAHLTPLEAPAAVAEELQALMKRVSR